MSHEHHHNHSHAHGLNTTTGRLFTTMALNFVITIVQVIGGIFSNSLALISDALHNLSDGVSIIISYFAIQLKKKDSSYKHTFGLKRAEILAAVINASALIVIYAFLFYEAVKRFMNPEEIEPLTMSIVAAIGLVANIIGTLLLKRDSKDSLNIRSAYMHLLSDSVSSVAVIFGAIAIALWKINWIDPVLTLLIGIYIVRESYVILSEAIHVLMEGTPPQIDVEKIQEEVEKFSEVDDFHHVHVWMVGENDVHLEAHVNITDMKISESNELRARIEKMLDDKFRIHHVTLQFECNQCPDVGLLGKHK
ncbi:MAG: cation diffusion facilitator family transporter [Ignavibacteria bacterium]|nr:MAG: cation diffusion facilitator family transporter [Ignavibacteria bacterium]